MLHTVNRTGVSAPADIIFDIASNVEHWPRILPHYRYVRVLSSPDAGPGRARVVKMGASRDGIPVSWTAMQVLDAANGQILYYHVAGATRGMNVVWKIAPVGDTTDVSIEHDLACPHWWLRPAPVISMVGRMFVSHIADQTLAGIKRHAEARGGRRDL